MATQKEIDDLYDKYNRLTEKYGDLTGTVQALTVAVSSFKESISDFISLTKKVLIGAFLIIILLLAIIAYGALGPDGFQAIKCTIPTTVGDNDPIISLDDKTLIKLVKNTSDGDDPPSA